MKRAACRRRSVRCTTAVQRFAENPHVFTGFLPNSGQFAQWRRIGGLSGSNISALDNHGFKDNRGASPDNMASVARWHRVVASVGKRRGSKVAMSLVAQMAA
ncbi:hypothetical protein [Xanthomonas graminis]|uniref:hypothetical protein n=1 Tax=Xanthomonas graminis TaxID=3390026 RepID=UPI001112D79D|nr:hypothetical protein [Xanthomonas translucens]